MYDARPLEILQLGEDAHEFFYIMPVKWAEIADIKTLKQVLLIGEQSLKAIAESEYQAAALLIDDFMAQAEAIYLKFEVVISARGVEMRHIFTYCSHVLVDSHIVVVEQDNEVVAINRSIVHSLESESATYRRIAYHSHHIAMFHSLQFCSHRHAQGCRNGVGCVTCDKRVVFALLRIWESAQPVVLTIVFKHIATACEYLMSVSLMSHVPYYAVVGRIEHIMQRHREVYRTHARSEVSGVGRKRLDKKSAQLGAHRRQHFH